MDEENAAAPAASAAADGRGGDDGGAGLGDSGGRCSKEDGGGDSGCERGEVGEGGGDGRGHCSNGGMFVERETGQNVDPLSGGCVGAGGEVERRLGEGLGCVDVDGKVAGCQRGERQEAGAVVVEHGGQGFAEQWLGGSVRARSPSVFLSMSMSGSMEITRGSIAMNVAEVPRGMFEVLAGTTQPEDVLQAS